MFSGSQSTNPYLLLPFVRISSTVFIFTLALVGVFYPYNRGDLFSAREVIYALTSGIAGYTGCVWIELIFAETENTVAK